MRLCSFNLVIEETWTFFFGLRSVDWNPLACAKKIRRVPPRGLWYMFSSQRFFFFKCVQTGYFTNFFLFSSCILSPFCEIWKLRKLIIYCWETFFFVGSPLWLLYTGVWCWIQTEEWTSLLSIFFCHSEAGFDLLNDF